VKKAISIKKVQQTKERNRGRKKKIFIGNVCRDEEKSRLKEGRGCIPSILKKKKRSPMSYWAIFQEGGIKNPKGR